MMSIESNYWISLASCLLCILLGILFFVLAMIDNYFGTIETKNKFILLINLVLFMGFGFVFAMELVPSVVAVSKQEYIETDCTVVECDIQEPGYRRDKYRKVVIYEPETGDYREVDYVGEERIDIEVGKTYRIKYYSGLSWIEVLYCVDDATEETQ